MFIGGGNGSDKVVLWWRWTSQWSSVKEAVYTKSAPRQSRGAKRHNNLLWFLHQIYLILLIMCVPYCALSQGSRTPTPLSEP